MSKIFYKTLITAIMALLLYSSCQKDFLNRHPQDTISNSEYWNAVNDLKLYCNNFYSSLPSYTGFINLGIYSVDGNSDNIAPNAYDTRLNGEKIVPSTGGGYATADWANILSTNYFLANYSKVLQKSDWDLVKVYVGEARFFRAWFYYEKLKNFGDLPWINAPLSTNDSALYYIRLSRSVIVDSIVNDLDSAAAYLQSKGTAEDMRVYKELALAFKSRVCLYEGTWEKYHQGDPFGVAGENGNRFLQQAADAAQQVMTSGKFTLDNVGVEDGYWKTFNQVSYSGSKEVMFWRAYNVEFGLVNDWPRYSTGGCAMGITKNLVDEYLCADGKPISVSALYEGDDSLARVVRGRDPRLRQTIYTPGVIVTDNKPGGATADRFIYPQLNITGETRNTTGYQIFKGHNTDYNQQLPQKSTQGQIIFRYGEILLNYAEAKAELGNATQEDINLSINLLRQRVGMPSLVIAGITTDPAWKFPALSPLINEIRRERRVELAVEGFRLDDIYRWAAAGKLIVGLKATGAKWAQWMTQFPDLHVGSNIFVDADGYIAPYQMTGSLQNGYKFNTGRDYLLPLPQDELTLNPNIGKQNPGW